MPHNDNHALGLQRDLKTWMQGMNRRRALQLFAGATLLPWMGCGPADDTPLDEGMLSACSKIPDETAGPYPGDGSNGPNALTLSGIVRSDIRSSLGSATGIAQGVPLTVHLTLVNTQESCAALSGYAVYLWHCDRAGQYSMYSSAIQNENYLRGVQETDSNGRVTFTTVFPGCYSGRWPHIHFEAYPTLASAMSSGNKVATSQLALPQSVCTEAYATTGYSASVSNLNQISLASDNVFRDGATLQLPTVSGDAANGFIAQLTVGLARG